MKMFDEQKYAKLKKQKLTGMRLYNG